MSRIRTVKPELFKHEGLFEAENAYQLPLRLAFIALFTCCDREGRFRWQPRRLKLDLLPYDEIDVSRVLDALATRGFIVKYEHQGELFGAIPTWANHQHVNNRELESELPSPAAAMALSIENTKEIKEVAFSVEPVNDVCPTCEACVPLLSEVCTSGIWNMEGNRERNMEGKGSIVASMTQQSLETQSVKNIFEHWKKTMGHPDAKLDQKRIEIIVEALEWGYNTDQLCEAITGCSYTPHNIGDNDRGQRYDGLHVILRDGDQIDRFIHNCHFPPKRISESDRRSQANVHALQDWMSKKIEEETAYVVQ